MNNTFAARHSTCLTDRDIEILKLIQSEGAKTSVDLDQKFWAEKSQKSHAGFQRIRKLVEAGFLEHGNPRLLYLSDEAKKFLADRSVDAEKGQKTDE